jgi:hypothetical protein
MFKSRKSGKISAKFYEKISRNFNFHLKQTYLTTTVHEDSNAFPRVSLMPIRIRRKIICIWVLKKWNGFIWLREGSVDGLLSIQ